MLDEEGVRHMQMCGLFLISWLSFQERVTVGRKPESMADIVPEGELILSINVYYPAVIEKVSARILHGDRSLLDLIVFCLYFCA